MNKAEMENKIKGLEGLVESYRNTTYELKEEKERIYKEKEEVCKELENTRRQYENKEKIMFNIWESDNYTDETFIIDYSEKEMEAVLKFIKTFNEKLNYLNISVYKEVYTND